MDWVAYGTNKVFLWGGFLMVAAEAGYQFLEDGMDELRTVVQLTDEQWASVTGVLLAASFAVVTWVVKRAVSWLRSDGANSKQKSLYDALVKRLDDRSREWREVRVGPDSFFDACPALHEFNDDGVLIADVVPTRGYFILSGERVDELLTKRQRRKLRKLMLDRLNEVRAEKVEQATLQAIVQARA